MFCRDLPGVTKQGIITQGPIQDFESSYPIYTFAFYAPFSGLCFQIPRLRSFLCSLCSCVKKKQKRAKKYYQNNAGRTIKAERFFQGPTNARLFLPFPFHLFLLLVFDKTPPYIVLHTDLLYVAVRVLLCFLSAVVPPKPIGVHHLRSCKLEMPPGTDDTCYTPWYLTFLSIFKNMNTTDAPIIVAGSKVKCYQVYRGGIWRYCEYWQYFRARRCLYCE